MRVEIRSMDDPTTSLRCDECDRENPRHRIIVSTRHAMSLMDFCDEHFEQFADAFTRYDHKPNARETHKDAHKEMPK